MVPLQKSLLILMMLLFLIFVSQGAFAWWDTSYNYRIKIVFENYSAGSTFHNFPIFIDGNSASFNSTHMQADCDDVKFVDADDLTDLNADFIDKVCSDGNFSAFVRVPNIKNNTDYIYVYYGKASATYDNNRVGTWDGNYTAVFHAEENSGNLADSTSQANVGTATGSLTYSQTGIIGKAITGDSTGYFDMGDDTNFEFAGNFTIITIAQQDISASTSIWGNGNGTDPNSIYTYQAGNYNIDGRDKGATGVNPYGFATTLRDDHWHLWTVTNDATAKRMCFGLDDNFTSADASGGASCAAYTYATVWGDDNASGATPFLWGSAAGRDGLNNSLIDELFVIKDINASPAYLKTWYQSLWSGLATFEAEETAINLVANFEYTAPIPVLDPDEGITSVTIDFNDISSLQVGTDANAWKWYDNSVLFSTDQNTSRTYTTVGDHNIMFWIEADDGNTDTEEKTITINNMVSGVDFTWKPHDLALTTWNIDFNGTADDVSDVSAWTWDFNGDGKASGQDVNHTFPSAGDYNVCLTATSISDENKMHCEVITPFRLTVKVPIDESNFSLITNYRVKVESLSQNLVQDKNNLSTDTNFFISNEDDFLVTVSDSNGNYYPRKYIITTVSGTAIYELQPYLSSISEGIITNVYTRGNQYSQLIKTHVLIKAYKYVSGEGRVLVESVLTDMKGEALMTFIANDTYDIEVWIGDDLIFSDNYISTDDTFYIYIDDKTFYWNVTMGRVMVRFIPSGDLLTIHYSTLTQEIEATEETIDKIKVVIFNKDSNIYSQTFTSGVSSGYTNAISLAGLTYDSNYTLDVYVFARTLSGKWYQAKTVYFFETKFNWVYLLQTGMRNDFGCSDDPSDTCSPLLFIALFITTIGVGALSASIGIWRADWLSFLGLAILAIFAYLWWVPWYVYLIMMFAGFGLTLAQWRMS